MSEIVPWSMGVRHPNPHTPRNEIVAFALGAISGGFHEKIIVARGRFIEKSLKCASAGGPPCETTKGIEISISHIFLQIAEKNS